MLPRVFSDGFRFAACLGHLLGFAIGGFARAGDEGGSKIGLGAVFSGYLGQGLCGHARLALLQQGLFSLGAFLRQIGGFAFGCGTGFRRAL